MARKARGRNLLEQAKVTAEAVEGTEGGFSVRLAADAPAFAVALDAGDAAGEFSDNSFTLLPRTPRTVTFRPRQKPPNATEYSGRVSLEKFRRGLTVRHLRETYR